MGILKNERIQSVYGYKLCKQSLIKPNSLELRENIEEFHLEKSRIKRLIFFLNGNFRILIKFVLFMILPTGNRKGLFLLCYISNIVL